MKKQKKSRNKLRKEAQRHQREHLEKQRLENDIIDHKKDMSQKSFDQVIIHNAHYEEGLDLIVFDVYPIIGGEEIKTKSYRMSCRFSDIQNAYNINGNVPTYLKMKFCQDIIGKVKNVKSFQAKLPTKEEIDDITDYNVPKSLDFWHQYPFYETYLLESGEECDPSVR